MSIFSKIKQRSGIIIKTCLFSLGFYCSCSLTMSIHQSELSFLLKDQINTAASIKPKYSECKNSRLVDEVLCLEFNEKIEKSPEYQNLRESLTHILHTSFSIQNGYNVSLFLMRFYKKFPELTDGESKSRHNQLLQLQGVSSYQYQMKLVLTSIGWGLFMVGIGELVYYIFIFNGLLVRPLNLIKSAALRN